MSISNTLRTCAATFRGTLFENTLLDAAARIEALEAAQAKDADAAVNECGASAWPTANPKWEHTRAEWAERPDHYSKQASRYFIEEHVVWVGAARGACRTQRKSWKIYDRSRTAQSIHGVTRPGCFVVAYFYDEETARRTLRYLNAGNVGEELKDTRLAEVTAERDEAVKERDYARRASRSTERLLTEARAATEGWKTQAGTIARQYEEVMSAATGRSMGVTLPEWITELERRNADNAAKKEPYGAAYWRVQYNAAAENVDKLNQMVNSLESDRKEWLYEGHTASYWHGQFVNMREWYDKACSKLRDIRKNLES